MNKHLGRMLSIVCITAVLLSAVPFLSFVVNAATNIGSADDYIHFITTAGNATDTNAVINITDDFELTGTTESNFAGTINGNGHVITISSGTALFNTFSGTVSNLGVISTAEITGSQDFVGVFANVMSGKAQNCFAYGSINMDYSQATDKAYRCVGGFCGAMALPEGGSNKTVSITNSFSCVSIKTSDAYHVGGFAGILRNGSTITSAYSAGDLDADSGVVAGFANVDTDASVTISDTYTSCQIVNLSNDAKPSGVNGLYDNQLSLMRENLANGGQKTKDLMKTTLLSDSYVITSTAYPALSMFYSNVWSEKTRDVVAVSITAAAFEDVNASDRHEPSDMYARADYLTYDSYIDRTNFNSISWSIDNENFKVYDTVPNTSYVSNQSALLGGSSSFLRSRYVFSESNSENTFNTDDYKTILKAKTNSIYRQWHLRVSNDNPYYSNSDGSATFPFIINNKNELNYVRFYTLHIAASYIVGQNFSCADFDPIVDFQGDFNGNHKTIDGIVLKNDRDGEMGLFANTKENTSIYDLTLKNVIAKDSSKSKISGALIGDAVGTSVTNVVLCGSSNEVLGSCAGGLIGKATDCTLENLLVSVEADGSTVGGLIGEMSGGTLKTAGVTGFVGSDAKTLGGLVGAMSDKASITDCYSTAVVISTANDSTAGGLVGTITGTPSLTNSYSAALTDGLTKDPLVGDCDEPSVCSYDGQFYNGDSTVISVSGDSWVSDSGYYPQLSTFAGSELSLASTEKFVYQQYWADAKADNSTTGWIPDSFKTPVVVEGLNGMFLPTVYSVEATPGHGFKAASGQSRIVLKTTSSDGLAVRYAAARRDDVIPVTYKVVGSDTLVDDPAAYMDISYSPNGTTWYSLRRVSLCDSGFHDDFYDIPKMSKIHVQVFTDDRYTVSSVTVDGSALNNTEGVYLSDTAYNSLVEIVVTLDKHEADWGVRRESY